ncbi:hypothetical protein RJ55_03833 [Drechmeria coniospora]|nr:hypothetical protein RJ55_03833 [Drechmeria coniospora]
MLATGPAGLVAALALSATVAAGYSSAHWEARFSTFEKRSSNVSRIGNIEAFNLSVPIDHYHNDSRYEPHSHDSFNLRYWLDTSNYRDGGPVIVLHSGGKASEERLPYLQHGIASMLTKATGGIGLILEQRYEGTSMPFTKFTVENLRFLSTEQIMADAAYFAQNVVFPGLEHRNLTAPNTPWIIYGGSYGGAIAAFSRKVYPDVFCGAIASSSPTVSIDDLWQFFEAPRLFAPGDCSPTQQKMVDVIDKMLFSNDSQNELGIKQLFDLGDFMNDEFARFLMYPIGNLQLNNWDPAVTSRDFDEYCTLITSDTLVYKNAALRPEVARAIAHAGYEGLLAETLTTRMLNWVGYIRSDVDNYPSLNRTESLRTWFSNRSRKPGTDMQKDERIAWNYHRCSELGDFYNGASTPKDRLPVVSRAYTYEYESMLCLTWFNITTRPNLEGFNKFGGYNFSFPRVAIINGAHDPWRVESPHAIGLPGRPSTTEEPFILIEGATHHWDENGLKEEDKGKVEIPPQIVDVQAKEVEFVKAWLETC